MVARFRSWWQEIKQHRVAIGVGAIIFVVVIALIIAGYWFDWTGFNGYNKVTITHTISGTNAGTVTRTEEYQPGKGLWDWLQLLGLIAIPVVVGIGAAWFTARQNHDREIAEEQRKADRELAEKRYMDDRELAERRYEADRELGVEDRFDAGLQAYFDKMTELLLHENLSTSQRHDVVVNIAQTQTLLFLINMEARRKGFVIVFLAASGLINRNGKIIDLSFTDLREAKLRRNKGLLDGISLERADLRKADFTGVELTNVNFQEADLSDANLTETDLSGADFNDADLSDADLSDAILFNVDLSNADLSGANLAGAIGTTPEQLEKAKSLNGATMPDGSIHP